jgi:hypothetical protein
MEDYFYILVGILWIVFSVIKARSKNKQSQSEDTTEETGRRSTIEDILGELLENEEYQQPEPIPQKKAVETITSSENTETTYQSLEEAFTVPEVYSQYTGEITDDNLLKGIYESLEDEKEVKLVTTNNLTDTDNTIPENKTRLINRDFDLRKAVVYSVILERPYA